MTDQPNPTWKKIAIRAVFGGIGLAIGTAAIIAAGVWYSNRPKATPPWNSKALTAKYDTMEFTMGASDEKASYPVDFYYNVQNNTNQTYQFTPAGLTPLAVLTDGNALSKDFGHYQARAATIDGPPFIPPGATVRIGVRVYYFFPDEFTDADKQNVKKISGSLGHRTDELNGFVIFDEQNHYRIDLPKGWEDTKTKTDSASATSDAALPTCPSSDPLGLLAKSKCAPLPARNTTQ
jgi:hypothetical protein